MSLHGRHQPGDQESPRQTARSFALIATRAKSSCLVILHLLDQNISFETKQKAFIQGSLRQYLRAEFKKDRKQQYIHLED